MTNSIYLSIYLVMIDLGLFNIFNEPSWHHQVRTSLHRLSWVSCLPLLGRLPRVWGHSSQNELQHRETRSFSWNRFALRGLFNLQGNWYNQIQIHCLPIWRWKNQTQRRAWWKNWKAHGAFLPKTRLLELLCAHLWQMRLPIEKFQNS